MLPDSAPSAPVPEAPSVPETEGTRSFWIGAGAVVVLAFLTFGQSVGYGFVNWDDPLQIVSNPLVKAPLALGWKGLLFGTPAMGYGQPLTLLTHHLDFRLGGGTPWPFHLGNLLLHATNAVLVLATARKLLQGRTEARLAAPLAGALFACHPALAETVCWCTGRKDLLVLTALLAGYLTYLGWRETRRGWALAALWVCFLAAVASKPSGVVLPTVLAADLLIRRQWPSRSLAASLVAMGMTATAWMIVAYQGQQQNDALQVGTPILDRLALADQHLTLQLRNAVLPTGLAPMYAHERLPRELASAWGLAGLLVAVALVATTVLAWRWKQGAVLMGIAWLLIVFAPSSGLVPLSRGPCDTYLYAAFPGLALCAAAGLAELRPPLQAVTGLAATLVFAFLGFVQGMQWSSSGALFGRLVDLYPDEPTAWMAYGEGLVADGRARRASEVMEEALARFPYPPKDPILLYTLGYTCYLSQRGDCAVQGFGEMVRHYPPDPRVAFRLLSAEQQYPIHAYRLEAKASRREAELVLRWIGAAPPLQRESRAQEVFLRYLGQDALPVPALKRLALDPELSEAAQLVLERYPPR